MEVLAGSEGMRLPVRSLHVSNGCYVDMDGTPPSLRRCVYRSCRSVYGPRGLTCRVTGREAILLAALPGMQSDAWYEVNWEEEEIGTSSQVRSGIDELPY